MIHSDLQSSIDLALMAVQLFKSPFYESKKKSELQKFKEKHGIVGVASPRGTIGYSEKEKKWYGFSHRAIFGFGIGHKVKPGHLPSRLMGQKAKTIDDAKRFAMAFSREI